MPAINVPSAEKIEEDLRLLSMDAGTASMYYAYPHGSSKRVFLIQEKVSPFPRNTQNTYFLFEYRPLLRKPAVGTEDVDALSDKELAEAIAYSPNQVFHMLEMEKFKKYSAQIAWNCSAQPDYLPAPAACDSMSKCCQFIADCIKSNVWLSDLIMHVSKKESSMNNQSDRYRRFERALINWELSAIIQKAPLKGCHTAQGLLSQHNAVLLHRYLVDNESQLWDTVKGLEVFTRVALREVWSSWCSLNALNPAEPSPSLVAEAIEDFSIAYRAQLLAEMNELKPA